MQSMYYNLKYSILLSTILLFIGSIQLSAHADDDIPHLNYFQIQSIKNQHGQDVKQVEISFLKSNLNSLLNLLIEQIFGIQQLTNSKLKTVPIFIQFEKTVLDIDRKSNLYLDSSATILLIEYIHYQFSIVKLEFPQLNQKEIFDKLSARIERTSVVSIFQNMPIKVFIEANPTFYPKIIEKLESENFGKTKHINQHIPLNSIHSEFHFSSYKLINMTDKDQNVFYSIKEQKLTGPDLDVFLEKLLLGKFPLISHYFPSSSERELGMNRLVEYVYRYNETQDRLRSWKSNRQMEFSEDLPYWIKLESLDDHSKLSCRQLFLNSN